MRQLMFVMTCLCAVPVVGCTSSVAPDTTATTSTPSEAPVDAAKYLLSEEPKGAKDIIAVRKSASDGDEVLLVGRIGGSQSPWVEGRAAFTIVDDSLKACSDIPGDTCKKPWDYCCETDKLPTSTALVKLVDENGEPVKADARKLLHVKELSRVIVKGKAKRDDAGNLTVLATGVFVKN